MRKLSLFLAILLLLAMLTPIVVHAEENDFGNAWVYDEANVVSDETEEYIRMLNESTFASYTGKPQLAFIVLNKLPYNITDYKLDMFNEYGVGTKEENRGMLFVFAISDREYALEIGDGFENGSILRKELETDFITPEMKTNLKAGNYDIVVKQVAEHLANMMADEENGVYAQKEAIQMQENQTAANTVINKIRMIGTVEYTDQCIKAINDAKNAYNKLTVDQRKLVSNHDVLVAASEKMNALQRERNLEIMKIVGIVIAAMCPVIGIVLLAIWLYKKAKYNNNINEMMEQYAKHMLLLKASPEIVCQRIKIDIKNEKENPDREYIKDAFPRLLCRYYVEEQKKVIRQRAALYVLENPINYYELAIAGANQVDSFVKCKVFDAAYIINEVDEEERKKNEIRNENNRLIEEFLASNLCRVSDKQLQEKIRDKFNCHRTVCNKKLTFKELDNYFQKYLKELSFEMEFERFCSEHETEINKKFFNKQEFYNSLKRENNYAQYRYRANRIYNNAWMLHFLMLHMATQKQKIERREREEQEARERRRREEEAARQRQRMQQNNSSFGSGFGGGFSSGGGFKGGW